MTKGIDENFYCSGYSEIICGHFPDCPKTCRQYHRKYPTPDQYKEEYGEEWKGAAYFHCTKEGCDTECDAKEWTTKEHGCLHKPIIVCACTPIGKPPSGWRPK